MATKSTSMSFNNLLTNSTLLSGNIKLNAPVVGRYGLDLPAFTDQLDADIARAGILNQEQERMKSELKSKTDELNLLRTKLSESYALGKKTVKMAEPQVNWIAYGIADKR